MRYILIAILCVVGLLKSSAQGDDQAAIEARIGQFIALSNQEDWAGAFDLIYPKLFTYVSKDELIALMDTLVSDGMKLEMNNMRIRTVSLPLVEGRETFVRVEYVADMTVGIRRDGKYAPPGVIEALTAQFKSIYGADKVIWDAESYKYEIIAQKAMIAVRNADNPDWYLLEINPDQPELMSFLFSPAVLARLVNVD